MIYGYARVSTNGQSVDAQVRQLKAAAKPLGLPAIDTDTDGRIIARRATKRRVIPV